MRERKLSDYYVNQEVWDFQFGWGTVHEITNKPDPIKCVFPYNKTVWYYLDGRVDINDVNPSLFFEEIHMPESAHLPKKWMPKEKAEYYYIGRRKGRFVICTDTYSNHVVDNGCIFQGNYFRTEKDAQEALDKILKLLKGDE